MNNTEVLTQWNMEHDKWFLIWFLDRLMTALESWDIEQIKQEIIQLKQEIEAWQNSEKLETSDENKSRVVSYINDDGDLIIPKEIENPNRKKEDPTRKLRQRRLAVENYVWKLPFDEVDELSEDIVLVFSCANLLGIIYYLEMFLNRRDKDFIFKLFESHDNYVFLLEKIPWFMENFNSYLEKINKNYPEKKFPDKLEKEDEENTISIISKAWDAYIDLLKPLLNLINSQKDKPWYIQKYFIRYIVGCWLLPYLENPSKMISAMWWWRGFWILFPRFFRFHHKNTTQNISKFLDMFDIKYRKVERENTEELEPLADKITQWSNFEILEICNGDFLKTDKGSMLQMKHSSWCLTLIKWLTSDDEELSRNLDKKIHEIQETADLILIYRDNNTYENMWKNLENIVKNKYWWNVYCIVFCETIQSLSDEEVAVLRKIINTCPCITDMTISKRTWIETHKIDDLLDKEDNIQQQQELGEEHLNENEIEFLNTAKNIENYCIEKWIDTVYILSWGDRVQRWRGGSVPISLLDHGWLCRRRDGTLYSLKGDIHSDERKRHEKNAQRFWESMFKKLRVEIINDNMDAEEGLCDYKAKWTLAIGDRHHTLLLKKFKEDGWQVISFAWCNFEPEWWIENFSSPKDYDPMKLSKTLVSAIYWWEQE